MIVRPNDIDEIEDGEDEDDHDDHDHHDDEDDEIHDHDANGIDIHRDPLGNNGPRENEHNNDRDDNRQNDEGKFGVAPKAPQGLQNHLQAQGPQ